jgi:hypothetical protein
LPTFPTFFPVERTDPAAIDRLTRGFAPYSEYNATNIWCWSHKYRAASVLNGNLVLQIQDDETGGRVLSFLGREAVGETAETLLAAADRLGCARDLRLVPEEVVRDGLPARLVAREDRDADYLLATGEWAALRGGGFARAREEVNRFRRRHDAEFGPIDLGDAALRRAALALFELWAAQKGVSGQAATLDERQAIERFFGLGPSAGVGAFGLRRGGALIGFLIYEIRPCACAVAHFWKADRTYRGIYPTLLHRVCAELAAGEVKTLNFGQDLGMPGLAAAKRSYRPRGFLRKYAIAARG